MKNTSGCEFDAISDASFVLYCSFSYVSMRISTLNSLLSLNPSVTSRTTSMSALSAVPPMNMAFITFLPSAFDVPPPPPPPHPASATAAAAARAAAFNTLIRFVIDLSLDSRRGIVARHDKEPRKRGRSRERPNPPSRVAIQTFRIRRRRRGA